MIFFIKWLWLIALSHAMQSIDDTEQLTQSSNIIPNYTDWLRLLQVMPEKQQILGHTFSHASISISHYHHGDIHLSMNMIGLLSSQMAHIHISLPRLKVPQNGHTGDLTIEQCQSLLQLMEVLLVGLPWLSYETISIAFDSHSMDYYYENN